MSKRMTYSKIYSTDVCTHPHLSYGRIFTVCTNCKKCICTDALMCLRRSNTSMHTCDCDRVDTLKCSRRSDIVTCLHKRKLCLHGPVTASTQTLSIYRHSSLPPSHPSRLIAPSLLPSLPRSLVCTNELRPHRCLEKKINNKLKKLGSCCVLEKRKNKFWFSIPKILKLCGQSRENEKVFWPNSPSHPSKLYSSLGWLNSKVPKPFFPFTPRLIDIDGF